MAKKKEQFTPRVRDDQKTERQAAEQKAIEQEQLTAGQKTSSTIQKKKEKAFQLEELPNLSDSVKTFPKIASQTARLIIGHDEKDTFGMKPEQLEAIEMKVKNKDAAFVVVRGKDGVQIVPTLSGFEMALTLAVAVEFEEQSRAFSESFRVSNEIVQRNDERLKERKKLTESGMTAEEAERKTKLEQVPAVRLGQNAEDLSEDFLQFLLAKYRITPREAYFDEKQNFYKPPKSYTNETGKTRFYFENEDGVAYWVRKQEENDGVLYYFCETKGGKKARIVKHEADKFILLNVTKFFEKYFKTKISNSAFPLALANLENLGNKAAVFVDKNGQFQVASNFYNVIWNVARHGRNDFALVKMTAPVFDGVEYANDYLKLTDRIDEILKGRSDVEIRFFVQLNNWRTLEKMKNKKRPKKKTFWTSEKFSGQEMFERFGAPEEVKQRRFSRFWPKFRTVLLHLIAEQELATCTVDGQPLKDDTQADKNSKFVFTGQIEIERRVPLQS